MNCLIFFFQNNFRRWQREGKGATTSNPGHDVILVVRQAGGPVDGSGKVTVVAVAFVLSLCTKVIIF